MDDDQFTKLFKYIEDFRSEINERMDTFDNKIDRLTSTLDKFARRLDTYEVEQAARDSQFERLLEWARKVSEKTGIPLENL